MLGYEAVIKTYELDQFIFYAPRTDFWSANREGICSLVGYISLQLIGIGLGNFIYKQLLTAVQIKQLQRGKQISCDNKHNWRFLIQLLMLALLFYGGYLCSCDVFAPASRRLCNLSFVLFHCACVLAGCSMAVFTELTHSKRQTNMVEDAITWNQLQFFVGCNLMTGLYQLIMETYH